MMLKQAYISILALDPESKDPVVILKEVAGERTLPIWVGLLEAQAIASVLEGVKFSRPMTHDLIKSILDSMEIKINRIVVSDLKDNTYHALISVDHKGRELSIDARPSDALALSLRVKAPIFVAEDVLRASEKIDLQPKRKPTKRHPNKKWQEILDESDLFGPEDD
jgi:bifunctional DNase/RNase